MYDKLSKPVSQPWPKKWLLKVCGLLLVIGVCVAVILSQCRQTKPLTIDEMDAQYSQEYTLQTLTCSMNCSMLYERAVNNTVMIVQIGGGTKYLNNMLCSLRRINESLIDRVVVWAYDEDTYRRLQAVEDRRFAVVHDREVVDFGAVTKENMMVYRPRFFLKIVKLMRLNLFFVDADIVFYRDPWPWVVDNLGLGVDDYRGYKKFGRFDTQLLSAAKSPWQRVDLLQRAAINSPPDMVYSSDARRFYWQQVDPFEGEQTVPKICGGLFLYRSTPNTIAFLQALRYDVEVKGGNDQWSVDNILNWRVSKVLLVGKLPRCLPRWNGMPPEYCDKETMYAFNYHVWPLWVQKFAYQNHTINFKEVLKVRVLDQMQFANGAIVKQRHIDGEFPSAMKFVQYRNQSLNGESIKLDPQSKGPAKTVVAYHGNYESEFDKMNEMRQIGAWMLDYSGKCPLESQSEKQLI
ncbi:hypothetical protein MP228_010382 [Amoeboaphelidium protococcarum]|nr:hypothetical protein MP228_010382 [Amoeboaphelidium protococcarum]